MAKDFQSLRGMHDILPEDAVIFDFLTDNFRRVCSDAGFGHIDTPLLEEVGVFVRGIGSDTDAVAKEMYQFKDRSDNDVALRPEGTAGVVRAYIEHGMGSLPQPVKLWYQGPMFRYDRPQAGRQRQFHQYSVEVMGEASSSTDAQMIVLAQRFFKRIGLTSLTLQINSIGDNACRPKFQKALIDYLSARRDKLAPEDQGRLSANPMRVLDSKEVQTQAAIKDAPQLLNFLCEACQSHFSGVLEYLDDLGIAYELNPRLVRGLDYYSRTVFEFYGEREGAQASLGGGGRYDYLIEMLGGVATPAVGFSLGAERIKLELATASSAKLPAPPKRVYVASLGEPARLAAFRLIEQLLDYGVPATGAVDKDGIGSQLSRADRLGVPYAIIIGQKEVREETVILRDMASGAQEVMKTTEVVHELSRRYDIK